MPENREGNLDKDKDGCCNGHSHCGRCCGGRAALALVLLLIGGLIGFGIGRCHSGYGRCVIPMHCPMSEPQTPPAK